MPAQLKTPYRPVKPVTPPPDGKRLTKWDYTTVDALQFAQLMAQRQLSVKDVADAVGMRTREIKLMLRGWSIRKDELERIYTILREKHDVVRPQEVEAPRIAPEKPVSRMTKEERQALARNPTHWAWLCHHFLQGTDGEPLRLMWFHVDILRLMFQGGKIVVNLPTDHMKSEVSSFVFPLLSLMNDPNESHIICGANLNDSKRRVQKLQREIETNEKLTYLYPWIAKPDRERGRARTWSTSMLTVAGRTVNKPNPSVLATAVGTSDIRGRRGKLIMDDIEGDKHRWSALARQQLYDFVKLEAIRCYESPNETRRPLLACFGTPFTVDTIYFKLEGEGWDCIRYPVYMEEGKLLWPEKQKKVEDARRHLNKNQFAIAYLMDPTGADPSMLSSAQIQSYMSESKIDPDGFQTFGTIDPAAGVKSRQADYCGIAIVRIRWDAGERLPKLQILRAYKVTEGLFEQVHMCAHLASEFGCPFVYETNGQQGGTYANAFQHLHQEVELVRHYSGPGAKFDTEMGLTVLKTLLRERSLQVPADQLDSEGIQTLITEVRDLGFGGVHDHIASAVWFVIRHMYERARMYAGPHLKSNYGTRTGLIRFGGHTNRFGFGGGIHTQNPVERAMKEEEERFERQLREGRA